MSAELISAAAANLLSPAVLYFLLGAVAALARSDLKFPEPIYVGLTIYLLSAIGFKGGVSVADAGIGEVWLPAVAALFLGALIPLWTYPVLRHGGRLAPADAAAISAHYGSVSAVTFLAAINFLKALGVPHEGYTSAFLAVMESPAIVVGILLGRLANRPGVSGLRGVVAVALKEAIVGKGVLLLVGSLLIGYLSGRPGYEATEGFFVTPFQGVLAIFLLEMGMVAARRLPDLARVGWFLIGFGTLMPLLNGALGAMLGSLVGLSVGGATLLAVMAASASYIAAPAAMRHAIPEANPTLYLTSALAITFPFNLTLGLPCYYAFARWWVTF